VHRAGLPDGIFSNQKSKFGYFLKCLAMEDVGIFYGQSVYFTAICYTLWTFGIFSGQLVYFSPILVCCTKKNLATLALRLDMLAASAAV
jgi:hypothetical protein